MDTRREFMRKHTGARSVELAHRAFEILQARCTVIDPLALEEFVLDQEVGLIGTLSFMISEAYQDFLDPQIELRLTDVEGTPWLLFVIKTYESWNRARVAERQFEKTLYATRGNIDRWHVMYDVEIGINL